MAKPIRIQFSGALYHIMTRGNVCPNIFKSMEGYQNFLLIFFNIIKRYGGICYAYCLMPNHYHLLIKTNEANLSAGTNPYPDGQAYNTDGSYPFDENGDLWIKIFYDNNYQF